MRPYLPLALAMAIVAAIPGRSAGDQGNAVYLVTYFDVMPNAVASGTALFRHYREASLKQDGNLRFDVLEEIGRPNRFAIVEAWRGEGELAAHAQAASVQEFRDKLKAVADAPYDERINHALYLGRGDNEKRSGTIYVLTHIDVTPSGKDDCMAALKAMSADTAKDPGNIDYEVLQQSNRANHFNVIEEWTTMKAVDDHAMAEHTRAFRATLIPIAGALYDERFYKALN